MMDWLDLLWLKAFHIIFVIAWMAGLLMLPRLMIYKIEAEPDGETAAAMDTAIASLRRVILTPSLIIVWVLGLLMIFKAHWPSFPPWLIIKLICVLAITGFHGLFVAQAKKIGTEAQISSKKLRMLNEAPFVLMIIAVIMVVVRPF